MKRNPNLGPVRCYLCGLKIYRMLRSVKETDKDGNEFYSHRDCFEKMQRVIND